MNADGHQITEYGGASDILAPSKDDERSTALALRARQGDYDDGAFNWMNGWGLSLMVARLDTRAIGKKSCLSL